MIHTMMLIPKTGRIKQFDRDFEALHKGELGEENRRPAWSPASNKIAFLTKIDYRTKMVVFDMDKDIIATLIQPGQFGSIDRLRWSPKEGYIAFDFEYSLLSEKSALIINMPSGLTGMKGQYGIDNSLIAFMGNSSGAEGLDIWTYSLLNNNPIKLTTDGHEKDGLMWYMKR